MAIIKCKMCGGELSFEEGSSVCECEYCGSKQTIPNVDDEKKAKLYERANRLRMNGEFDKAYGVYESIVSDFEEDAEAYWGLVLCKYGIEYVEDPASGNRIPTCHRSSFDSVMKDENFEMVMEYSDSIARGVYREQTKAIEEIRKGIVEVSSKEEPYDIFICYKETAEDGQRTIDSVIAQDVYDALTDKGYRVFFSRITLEDKLGQEYEPYIFAALNSAKIMLAFGTSYDYYNAVWVKNEWSRFLKIMSKEKGKYLIPCYKDIDAYDIPEEFAKFQSQDMGKVGAVQDLVRGIEKLLPKNETKNTASAASVTQIIGGPNVDALLKRGFMALEDKEWDNAKDFFNQVLNMNAECAEAYLGLLMEEIKVSNEEKLGQKLLIQNYTFEKMYKRAKQFADSKLRNKFEAWETARADKKRAEKEAIAQKKEAEAREREEQSQLLRERKELHSMLYNLIAEKSKPHSAEAKERSERREQAKVRIKELRSIAEKEDVENLRLKVNELLKRRDGLGLFKGKEKKELQSQIDEFNAQIEELAQIVERKECENPALILELENEIDRLNEADDLEVKPFLEEINEQKRELENRIKEISGKLGLPIISEIGETVYFGSYPYNNENDIQPIQWRVLEVDNGKALLITQYGIDAKAYCEARTEDIYDEKNFVTFEPENGVKVNPAWPNANWEKCTLRKWLNTEFFDIAFSEMQKECIISTKLTNVDFKNNAIRGGNDTEDKIFILSVDEAERYFENDADRIVKPTPYAVNREAFTYHNTGNGLCWLRTSPCAEGFDAAWVGFDGEVCIDAGDVNDEEICVRPAMWIEV